jgi:hypothetical protein
MSAPAAGGGGGAAAAAAADGADVKLLEMAEFFRQCHIPATRFVCGKTENSTWVYLEGFGLILGVLKPGMAFNTRRSALLSEDVQHQQPLNLLNFINAYSGVFDVVFVSESDYKKGTITCQTRRHGEVALAEVMELYHDMMEDINNYEKLSPAERRQVDRPGAKSATELLENKARAAAKKAELEEEAKVARAADLAEGERKKAEKAELNAKSEL